MKSKSLYYITYEVSNGKTGLEKNVYKNDDGHIYIFELFLQLYNIWFYFSSWFVKKHKFIRRCKCLATCNILLNESQSYVINIFTDISHYQSYFR